MIEIKIIRTDSEKELLRNKDLEHTVKFFTLLTNRTYIAALKGDRVVGLAALVEDSIRQPGSIGLGYISTHRDYRNQGIAKVLVQALFELVLAENKNIVNTHYEMDGLMFLEHVMHRVAKLYPSVILTEQGQA